MNIYRDEVEVNTQMSITRSDTVGMNKKLTMGDTAEFKIDQNKNQNRSIDKVQSLGNERR